MLHVEQNTIISLRVRLVEVNIGHSACSACVMIDRAGIQIVQLLFFIARVRLTFYILSYFGEGG